MDAGGPTDGMARCVKVGACGCVNSSLASTRLLLLLLLLGVGRAWSAWRCAGLRTQVRRATVIARAVAVAQLQTRTDEGRI